MKKFTKLFLSCALVSVVAAASASIAMAADGDVALTGDLTHSVYNPTSNTITIASDDVPEIVAGTQATYLVVEGTDKVEGKIEGIDQATGVAFDKTGLTSNPTEATEKEYTVYVGYYKGESNEFKIVKGKLYPQAGDGKVYIIGDADLDGKLTPSKDATFVMWRGTDNTKAAHTNDPIVGTYNDNGTEKAVTLVGDADLDGKVTPSKDATFIMWRGTDNKKAAYTGEKVNVTGLPETYVEPAN